MIISLAHVIKIIFLFLNRSDDHNKDEEEQEQQKVAKAEVNKLMHSASLNLVTYSEVITLTLLLQSNALKKLLLW